MKAKNIKVLLVLIVLYSLYDIFNSAGTGNSNEDRRGVYIFLLAIVFYMILSVLIRIRNTSERISINKILFFEFFLTLYIAFDYIIVKQDYSWNTFIAVGLPMWWLVTTSYFSSLIIGGQINYKSIISFSEIMFMVYSFAVIYGAINIVSTSNVNYARVGYIYYLLSIYPIILLEQKRMVKAFFTVTIIVLTILSFKRGAIVALTFMIFAYYFIEGHTKSNFNKTLNFLATLIFLIVVWYIVDAVSNGFLSSRFTMAELADGSGRSELRRIYIENISTRNFFQLLFGIRNSNEYIIKDGAHNEWIAHLSSLGLIGVLLFGLIFIFLFARCHNLIKTKSEFAPSYSALVVYLLIVSMVSGLLFVHSTFYIMIYIGMIEGIKSKQAQYVN